LDRFAKQLRENRRQDDPVRLSTEWAAKNREDEAAARMMLGVAEELGLSKKSFRQKLRRVQEQRRQGYRVIRARGNGITRPRGSRCCRAPQVLRGRARTPRAKPVRRAGSRRGCAPTRAGPDDPAGDDDPPGVSHPPARREPAGAAS